ncbi:integrase core domain-containing protein [Kitasatospora sp. NPDC088391]|uniref:integrase core domain-containing protein n=1 Tax=Kitasatospora sp. NPDC088391 TaxID=3364074 RepID=UPI0037F6ACC2
MSRTAACRHPAIIVIWTIIACGLPGQVCRVDFTAVLRSPHVMCASADSADPRQRCRARRILSAWRSARHSGRPGPGPTVLADPGGGGAGGGRSEPHADNGGGNRLRQVVQPEHSLPGRGPPGTGPQRVRSRVRTPGQNGSRERGFGSLRYEKLFPEGASAALDLVRRAEDYRREYNTVRPHDVCTVAAAPLVPDFPEPENLPTA